MSALVIGVGHPWRGDDAAGLEVARRVRAAAGPGLAAREHEGDAIALVDTWQGTERVTIVDAAASGAPPGTVHRFDATAQPLPARLMLRSSTHAFGVPDAIELARALGRLPTRLEVYAIEGADFSAGDTLSEPVALAVDALAAELADQPSSAPNSSRLERRASSTIPVTPAATQALPRPVHFVPAANHQNSARSAAFA